MVCTTRYPSSLSPNSVVAVPKCFLPSSFRRATFLRFDQPTEITTPANRQPDHKTSSNECASVMFRSCFTGTSNVAPYILCPQEWKSDPLQVLPSSDNSTNVSDTATVIKEASGGLYPMEYTLSYRGTYVMNVTGLDGQVRCRGGIMALRGPIES